MYNVARLATPPQLRRVYDLFTGHNTFLGYDTRLHYANRFGEEGDHEYALRCLRDTVRHVSDATTRVDLVARRRFSWSSALILRKSVKNGQNYHMTTDIVAEFLNIGLKLDLLLYNVIIHNAIEAGDYETAFRVFNLLKDHHITPDKHTFSILLHGCTILDNPTRFHDFALHCAEKAHELRDPWLATDYLYYQYIIEDKHHLEQRIACTRAYTKLFSIDPLLPFCPELKAFSMHENGGDTQEESDVPKMEPPPAALYTMLQFEIRKAAAVGPRKVWDLLFLFRSLVLEGRHAGLTKLAKEPLIWNVFLLSFCRKQQFANASQLMKNMTDGLLGFPQPNVYSWNIFMQAFWKSGQHKGAERIYEIMRSRGVEPDQFTYGVLLKGYARAQNAGRVAEYLHLVDHEEQLDPAILQVLTRIHDQKRLMMELEKDRVMREREQRKRVEEPWGLPQFQSLLSSTQFANLNKPEESLGGRPGSSPLPADRTFTSLLRRPLSLPVSAPRSVTESGVTSTNPESADIHTPPMPVRKVKAKRTVPMKRATRSVPTRRRIKP
jgi:pentatricopeptide repeat protein